MKWILIAALLAGTPVPIAAQAPEAAEPAKEGPDKAEAKDFDPAQMLAVFDKMFPAQPDPAPERLALSRVTASAMFPDGTYARIFDDMMGGVVDRVMGLSDADFAKAGGKGDSAKALTFREQAIKKDPHFEERMRIMRRVVGEEFARIASLIEPRMREGVARSIARRFDEPQLVTVNAFLATETGQAFGSQMMAMWVDPDVMRAMVTSFPEMIVAMPAAMKRIEAATAHLPKPPKPKKDEKKKDSEEPKAEADEG